MKILEDNGLTDKLWELCNVFFSYQSEIPSLDDFAVSMIVTYVTSSLKGTVPAVFKPYILRKLASENEVFNACNEAIIEIYDLIKQLIGDVFAAKFIITADHGFLYKRDRLQEFDKVTYPREICTYMNKRFLITKEEVAEPGMASRMMTYMNHLYVTTPIGADTFKVAGGGQNYVHGGSALQEMMVPVIELTTNTRGVAYDYVDVVLTSSSRKVTNLITYFEFTQSEKVTDTMKARSIIAYFTDEAGEKSPLMYQSWQTVETMHRRREHFARSLR